MKIKVTIMAVTTIIFMGFYGLSLAESALKGEVLSIEQAEKMWGRSKFSPEKFKAGSPEIRSKMSVELIESKAFISSTVDEVKQALGKKDGYYKNDFIPAYALNEGWKKNEDTWQLVFLPNQEGKVKDVFIHKNCCPR